MNCRKILTIALTAGTLTSALLAQPVLAASPTENQEEGTLSKPDHPDTVSADKLIFIGDSRTEGIRDAVQDDSVWSCLSSMGYDWMVSTGVPQVEDEIEDNTAVIILMGVNDLYHVNDYLSYINEKAVGVVRSWRPDLLCISRTGRK